MNAEGISIYHNLLDSKKHVQAVSNLAQHRKATLMLALAKGEEALGFKSVRRYTNGSIVQIHELADKDKSDYKDLKAIAEILAKESPSIVQLTPRVHKDSELYRKIYKDNLGTPFKTKCQDLKVIHLDGRIEHVEYESYIKPKGKRTLGNMLKRGFEQSSRVIIDIKDEITKREVADKINGRLGQWKIDSVMVFDGKGLTTIYTKEKGFAEPYRTIYSRKAKRLP